MVRRRGAVGADRGGDAGGGGVRRISPRLRGRHVRLRQDQAAVERLQLTGFIADEGLHLCITIANLHESIISPCLNMSTQISKSEAGCAIKSLTVICSHNTRPQMLE